MINPKYLKADVLVPLLQEVKQMEWVQYLLLEDFIEPNVYNEIYQEVEWEKLSLLRENKWQNKSNKTFFIKWEKLSLLQNYLLSDSYEKFLSIIFWCKVQREFYLPLDKLGYWNWLLWQVYQEWDYYDWHIDGSNKWQSLGAFSYYLDSNYTDWSWWELEFWRKNNTGFWWYKKIIPKKNTIVFVFYAHDAYHRVNIVESGVLNRLSVQATVIKK